jgi:hypothetical protein
MRHMKTMRSSFGRGAPAAALAGLIGLAGAGCGNSNTTPPGSPVLQGVYWMQLGQATMVSQVWSADGGGTTAPMVAAPQQFDLLFDRPIDGTRVEYTDGSMQGPVAKAPVSVKLANGDDLPPSNPPFQLSVWYSSTPPAFVSPSSGTAYVYGRQAPAQPEDGFSETPGYPSGSTLQILIDKNTATGLVGKLGEPIETPGATTNADNQAVIEVQIAPFTLSIAALTAPVLANARVQLQFSAKPYGDQAMVASFIHVQASGADVPFKLVPSPTNPTLRFLEPADSISSWPAGVPITVTVDPGLPDAYMVPLAEGQSTTFTACETPTCGPVDGGVATTPDGGVADAPDLDAPAAD